MKEKLLIAETGESGEIVALWRAGGDLKSPRLIRDPAEALVLIDTVRISGAHATQVKEWLSAQGALRDG